MAPRKQTTPRKCAVIVQMYKDGRTERHTAFTLKLAKTAVHKCIARYRETGSGESRNTKERHGLQIGGMTYT